jgi:hypothetical protein
LINPFALSLSKGNSHFSKGGKGDYVGAQNFVPCKGGGLGLLWVSHGRNNARVGNDVYV